MSHNRRETQAGLLSNWGCPDLSFWCCCCLMPTPDGYHNKEKVRCQSKFASVMQRKWDSIRAHRDSECYNLLPAIFHVFKMSSIHLIRPQFCELFKVPQRDEMEFNKSHYFGKWIWWQTIGKIFQTFRRLRCSPDIPWHVVTSTDLKNTSWQTKLMQ